LTNIKNITRIKQTGHIKDKIKIITKAKVFKKALKAAVISEVITVIKAVINITYYLHVKKSVIFIIS
jgi:hypothetical protein